MAVFSKNCNKLKEFSCDECSFSDLGLVNLLNNCSQLEVLFVNRLFNACGDGALRNFHYVVVAKSLKVAELRSVYSDRFVEALITGSKNLKCLKVIHCGGNWDRYLEMIPDDSCLAEVHLENVNVTDVGVSSLSKCRDLIALHIERSRCTDVGLISVAENCKGLKKLYVGSHNERRIGDEGLIAVGKHSVNLQELFLIRVNAYCISLEVIATNCHKLVRIELCRIETITDVELSCIAQKCVALKILCIEECRVSNKGIEALGLGCPNLVNLRIANSLMDQKVRVYAAKQANNKRRMKNNPRDNHAQQSPYKRQNVARAYTVGSNEKKENCKEVGHLARDCRGTTVIDNQRAPVANQRTLACFECGNQGHYRSEFQKLKNQNYGNQAESSDAPGRVYASGR
uniref:CCHC-type domain-containing protein n=1 Tax=Tanacetum cinerariifolium TaxID=118510 RepID=A0A6L2KQR1_TANCI|nr:hypothetical protein [Tanacetum cinerariifolium]